MEKKNLMKKVICGAVMGSMVLSMGGMVFANELKTEATGIQGKQFRLGAKIEKGLFGGGVTDPGQRQKGFGIGKGQSFEKLVEAGIITQTTADAMKTYLEAEAKERKEAFEKIKDMSVEEKKAYLEAHKKEKVNIFDQMIKDGVISEEQGTKIKAYFEENKPSGQRGERNGKGLKTVLDKLVEEGKLKQDTANAIKTHLEAKANERKAEFEKIKAMSDEEKKAYLEERKKERQEVADKIKNMSAEERKAYFEANKTGLIEQLIEEDIITEAEGQIIKEAMPQRKFSPLDI